MARSRKRTTVRRTPRIHGIDLMPPPSFPLRPSATRLYEVVLRDSRDRRIHPRDLPSAKRPRLHQMSVDPRQGELLTVDENNLTFVIRCCRPEPTMVTLLLDTGSPQRGYREIERVTSPVEFPVLVSFLLNLQESSCSICIDAGHGGIDHGTTASHDGTDITEAELNQKMVRLIYDEVMKIEDCRPFLVKATVSPRGERSYPFAAGSTRDAKRQDLRTRPQLCEEKGGKCLFVSLHHNAADSRRARGTEVFYFDPDRRLRENPPAEEKRFIEDNLEALRRKRDHSKACAHKLSDCITEVYTRFDREWRNRGAKYNDLTVIERGPTDMPAVLAELGFVTNPDDLAVLVNERAQKAVARAIAGCVCQCCREARDIDAPLPA